MQCQVSKRGTPVADIGAGPKKVKAGSRPAFKEKGLRQIERQTT
jgi:hypothetical protein